MYMLQVHLKKVLIVITVYKLFEVCNKGRSAFLWYSYPPGFSSPSSP